MIQEFSQFRTDIVNANPAFQFWGPLLNLTLIFGVALFRKERLAWMVSITTIISLVIAVKIHSVQPLARIIGVCHAVWLPVLPFLVVRLGAETQNIKFRIYLAWVIVLMAISLAFDVFDVYRYLFTPLKTFDK